MACCFLVNYLCFFLLPLLPISTTAQNASLGESLIAGNDDKSSWKSPSGEFAFGFQRIENENFLLAIYFNKIPERTIVWSANGKKNPVQRGSKVQLNGDGRLVLTDLTGKQVWSPDHTADDAAVAYASMLDSGNFLLAGLNSIPLWESFDHPTDTMLPTQTLNQGRKLSSRYSEKNYSSGRYELTMQSDGNLVLYYTTALPSGSANNSVVWSSNTVGIGFQVIFNQSGNIYLTAQNRSIIYMLSSASSSSMQDFYYQRATLEFDGVLRPYVYLKKKSSMSIKTWSTRHSTESFYDPNICMISEETGSGTCGFNSYCLMGNDQTPSCHCPPGYVFLDPNDSMKGCKQNFLAQNCDSSSTNKEVDLFALEEIQNTDWPYCDYEHSQWVTEDLCRQACLSDCFCAVAIFRNGECWKKKMPLSNGRMNPSVGGKALIKVRKGNSSLNPEDTDSKKKHHSTFDFVIALLLSSTCFLISLLLLGSFLLIFVFGYKKAKIHQMDQVMPGTNLRSFTYSELEKATHGFKEKLGRGAFATVYKGVLTFENETCIAVKKLENTVSEGDKEFRAEVSAIGRTNHKNLVKLLGYCNEGRHQILVYEFISNGSLAGFLFGNRKPIWYQRMQIAFGTARGLFYLHEECTTRIIHCDIKPQNILLDDSFTARISDFGLAKILKPDQTRTTTGIRGTRGYVAPEWFKSLPITIKVDVYSFGIMLLELICCRKNFEQNVENENQMILVDWAYDCYKDETLHLLVENDEEALHDMKRLKKYVMIAIWCVQEDPSLRPTMKKVTQMLEGVVEVSIPPDPYSFISSI